MLTTLPKQAPFQVDSSRDSSRNSPGLSDSPESSDSSRTPFVPSSKVVEAILHGSHHELELVPEILKFLVDRGCRVPEGSVEAFETAAREIQSPLPIASRASMFSDAVIALQPNEHFIHVGTLGRRELIPPLLREAIPAESLKWLEEPEAFFNLLKKTFLQEGGVQLPEGVSANADGVRDFIIQGMSEVQKELKKVLPSSWYEAIVDSLAKDCAELIGLEVKGSLLEKILDSGVEKAFQDSFKTLFSNLQSQLVTLFDKLTKQTLEGLPDTAKQCLELCGISHQGNVQFWIEVTCIGDDRYDITLHGNDSTHSLAPLTLPLTFHSVPKSLLHTNFWEAILRFSTWANEGVDSTSTIEDLYATLKELLGKEGVSSKKPINGGSLWEMTQSYLGGVDSSFTEGLVEEPKELSTTPRVPLTPSRVFPPFLVELAQAMGPDASDLASLKKALTIILGEDVGDSLDDILQELPRRVFPHTSTPGTPKTLVQIFGFDFITDVKKMRVSLLHAMRLMSKITSFIAELASWIFSINFLTALLNLIFPGLGLVISIPLQYLAALLLMYGHKVLKEFVPLEFIDKIKQVFNLYYAIKGRIEYEIKMLMLKIGARYLLDETFVASMRAELKAFQATVTQGGTLDYTVTPPEKKDSPHLRALEVSTATAPIPDNNDMITEETTETLIFAWAREAKEIACPERRMHYIHTQLRKFPIPGEAGGEFWETCENPDDFLSSINSLIKLFIDFDLSAHHKRTELVTSLYTLYAITDTLARNPNNSFPIPSDYQANGARFLYWMNTPGVRPIRGETREKMKALARYFGGDPDKVYTQKEQEAFAAGSLFEDYGRLSNGTFPAADKGYLEHVLRSTLTTHPLTESNTALLATLNEYKYPIHKLAHLFTITPELKPYYLLRSIDRISTCCTFGRYNSLIKPPSYSWIRPQHEHRFITWLHEASLQIGREVQIGITSFGYNYEGNGYYVKESYLGLYISADSTRSQSKIVLNPVKIQFIRPEISILIEMLDQVKADQIVRALSLFIHDPSLLSDTNCCRLLETTLLRPYCIRKAFEDRPEVLPELGNRLFDLANTLLHQEPLLAAYLAKLGEEFIFLSEECDPNIRSKFPNFRHFVRDKLKYYCLLCSMYVNVTPENATPELRDEVLFALNKVSQLKEYTILSSFRFRDVPSNIAEVAWTWGFSLTLNKTTSESSTTSPNEVESKSPDEEWEVDLSITKHGLHLLEWFQPLSSAKIFAKGEQISRIEFKKLELSFAVKLDAEMPKAFGVTPALKSFYIAPQQKNSALTFYVHYLLLENETGERKVVLPTLSNEVLFGSLLLHHAKEFISPLIEKYLAHTSDSSNKTFTYDLTENDTLESTDPEALTYLTLLHTAKQDFEKVKFLLLKLELLGKKQKFSKLTQLYINALILHFFCANQNQALLRLAVISEENRLIQSTFEPEIQIALWVMVQAKYDEYLKNEDTYLSEIDELFLFKYIQTKLKMPKSLDILDNSFSHLMTLPSLAKRYLRLHRKYYQENTFFSYLQEGLLNGAPVLNIPTYDLMGAPTPKVSLALQIAKKVVSFKDIRSWPGRLVFNHSPPIGTVTTTHELTPIEIRTRFLNYYKILYEREAGTYEQLSQNLQTLHTSFRQKPDRFLLHILQTLAKTAYPQGLFPTPGEVATADTHYNLLRICFNADCVAALWDQLSNFNPLPYILPKIPDPFKLIEQLRQLPSLSDLPPTKKANTALNRPIDSSLALLLAERETAINKLFLLEGGEILPPNPSKPLEYPHLGFDKLNQSLADYASRPTYTPLTHSFEGSKEAVIAELEKEKAEIEELVGLPFTEIEDRFLKGDDSLFSQEILQKIYLYKVSISRFNAFFERGSLERVYQFDEIPEKALRVLLTFEEKAKTLLWRKQWGPLKHLIEETSKRSVSEAVMGLGKTDALMPIADKIDADGETLVINIRPAPIAVSASEKSSTRSYDLFSQITSKIPLSRSNWSAEKLEALYLKITQMIQGEELWDATEEEFQSFKLRFIEEAIDLNKRFESNSEEWHKRIGWFQKILFLIRQHGRAHIDEAHVEFEQKTELNFPLGPPLTLPDHHVEVMEEVLLTLIEFVDLKQEAPNPIPRDRYNREILPLLAKKLSNGDPAIEAYLKNEAPLSATNPRIDLMKGMLTHLLPSILEEIIHVSYTKSNDATVEYVKPSDGNEAPVEGSSFKSPFAAWIKTAFLLIHDRLTETQIKTFIDFLKKRAINELQHKSASTYRLNQTKTALYFEELCPGYQLFSFTPEDQPLIYKILNAQDRFVLDYARLVIKNQIRYFGHSLSSNSHNFASMFASFSGYTASPYNHGTYPQGTKMILDPGTQGETLALLQRLNPPCYTLVDSSPKGALHEILHEHFNKDSNYSAIIDRGAVFNGLSNAFVAKEMLDYIKAHRPELKGPKGIVFYDAEKALVIWEVGKDEPIPLSRSQVPIEARLTYFDETHTYAADIKQKRGGRAMVTVGAKLITEEEFQALGRMRGRLTENQTFAFIMTRETKELISLKKEPTHHDILLFAQQNQDAKVEEEDYHSDLAAIKNIVYWAVLDKAIIANTTTAISIIRSFRDLFLDTTSDNPSDLFGGMDTLVTDKEMFDSLKKTLLDKVTASPIFNRAERQKLMAQLQPIGMRTKIKLVQKREAVSVNARQQLSISEQENQETVQQQQTQVQQAIQQKLQTESDKLSPVKHKSWCYVEAIEPLLENIDTKTPFTSSYLTDLSLFSIRQVLKNHQFIPNHSLSRHIDPRISATNNLLPTPSTAFDEFQIPLLEALIIEDEKGISRFLLLSSKDAAEWRGILKQTLKGPFAIFDINTGVIVSESKKPLTKSLLQEPEFKLMLLQIKFLRGDCDYFDDASITLLESWLNRLPLPLLEAHLAQPHLADRYKSSTLEYLFHKIQHAKNQPLLRI